MAQDSPRSRFQIKATISPNVAFRMLNLRSNAEPVTGETIINRRNEREIPEFGYSASFSLVYEAKEYLNVEIGVQYSNIGYQSRWVAFQYGVPYDQRYSTPQSIPFERSIEEIKFVERFQYLGIPVKLNFLIGKGQLRFIAGLGLVTEFLVSANNTGLWKFDNNQVERSSSRSGTNYRNVNFSPQITAGVMCRVNARMTVTAEPTFNFGTISIIDAPIATYLWNAGVGLGFQYRF